MKKETIVKLNLQFDAIVNLWPDSDVEFWFARDLQEVLGYDRWENFIRVVQKAVTSCSSTGLDAADHFREVTKKVEIGSGAQTR